MIELARFTQLPPARLLMEALRDEAIEAQLLAEGDHHVVYIADAARFQQARDLLDALVANPYDQRFSAAAWRAGETELKQRRSPPLMSGNWLKRMGPVTKVVLILCVAVFGYGFFIDASLYHALLFAPSWGDLAQQPWRLVTPVLLHFSVLHIVFNLLWWSDLGSIIERFQSSSQLLLVALVTGVAGNLLQFSASGPNFGGMSGVVYGLLGYLWMYGRSNPEAGYALRREVVVIMMVWLVICWVGLADVVANEAHFGGLASGCILGVLVGNWRRKRYYGG